MSGITNLPEVGSDKIRHIESDPYQNRDFLIFKTRNGGRYLYDSATNTIHPWQYPLSDREVGQIYAGNGTHLTQLEFLRNQPVALHHINLLRGNSKAFQVPGKCPHASLPVTSAPPRIRQEPSLYSDLVLIATESCNQRCHYCVYSDTYSYDRDHGAAMLKLEDACLAVDHFLELNDQDLFKSIPRRNINIFFYGGEPLLNYEVVEQTIRYAAPRAADHYTLTFGVATNLTLLTGSMLDFFREYGVGLSVSIDGPQEEHDRHRRFADGTPTWSRVMQQFEMIRGIDEDYYFNHVVLSVTMTGHSDVEKIYNFFNTHGKDLPPVLIVSSLKNMSDCKFHQQYPYSQEQYDSKVRNVLLEYLNIKKSGKRLKRGDFLYRMFEQGLSKLYNRFHTFGSDLPEWYTGTCYPGRKLTVAPDGNYYTCERVNYDHPVGNVKTGLDPESIKKLLRAYNEALPDCNRCWARNICTICYSTVTRENGFDFSFQCNVTRLEVASQLITLCTVLELDPAALSEEQSAN